LTLLDLPARDLLDRLASPDPTPGGGSAAALAGATGGALAAMVCAMPKTRSGASEERAVLDKAGLEASQASTRLRALVDLDAEAYNDVLAAYKLPKASDAEKGARKTAIAKAMGRATDVPLETAGECLRVMGAAGDAFRHGNPSAASDAKTGALLALAGLLGGVENVRINAPAGSPEVARAVAVAQEGLRLATELGLTDAG
jgi:formiminotetrahydrofolate cyclodeaminase